MPDFIYKLSGDSKVHTYKGSTVNWNAKKNKLKNITSWHQVVKLRKKGFPKNYGQTYW